MPRDPNGLSALRIDLSVLQGQGVAHHAIGSELPMPWVAEILADTDAKVSAPGKFDAELFLQSDGMVVVRGSLLAQFMVPCGRCLDPAQVRAPSELCATFVGEAEYAQRLKSADANQDEDGTGLTEEDLDLWSYRGTVLDLQPVLREQIKLAYPMRVLCSRGEACRGLCSSCGASLNSQTRLDRCEQCGAPTTEGQDAATDGPLAAALQKIKLPEKPN